MSGGYICLLSQYIQQFVRRCLGIFLRVERSACISVLIKNNNEKFYLIVLRYPMRVHSLSSPSLYYSQSPKENFLGYLDSCDNKTMRVPSSSYFSHISTTQST